MMISYHPNGGTKNIWRETIMAYKITDACVKCGACAENCPVEAISEGEDKYVIDADTCVSCGACCDNCPVEAIVEE
jgi:ferredoxin